MGRALAIIVVIALAALAMVSVRADTPSQAAKKTTAQPVAASTTLVKNLTGVGSCSASACHGASSASKEPWRSAYTVWATEDRHSQAYAVLFDKRSVNMTKWLGLKPPHEESLCLSCHTLQGANSPSLPRTILSDGVGCEACHGPAKNWLVSHTLKDHNSQQLGMTNTGDVLTRAKLCVDCHVGTPPQGSSAARDVNHDLIAAGHPRLAFELTSYLEAMPPHWTTPPKEDPVDVWATGRLTSLEAALDLLACRAGTSNSTASASAVRSPWPEFAEFDCFNCHRPMVVSETTGAASAEWPLGLPKQNLWQVAVVNKLFEPAGAKQPAFIWMDVADPWKPIDPAALQSAEADLKSAWDELATWRSNKPTTQDLLQRLDADGMIDDTNWDEAAQLSLALAALAARERQALPKEKRDELDKKIAALREAVQFPQHIDRTGSSYHFDSPRNYSPDEFRKAKQSLVAILQEFRN